MQLRRNAYYRMLDEDVVDHIAKVLEMLDLNKIPNVDSHRLRMMVFPLSLADDARQWWIDEGDGITNCKELVEKFFCKFYPLSRVGKDEMLEEGRGMTTLSYGYAFWVNQCTSGFMNLMNQSKEEHEVYLKLVLELLKKEKLFAKFSKCEFWLQEDHFLTHVVNNDGNHVDPSKIEAIKNWKVAKHLTSLTGKNQKYEWGKEQEEAF
ncbi:hypothetical protein Tco_0356139 [Tanacetum coccineum]